MNVQFHMVPQLDPEILAQAISIKELEQMQTDNADSSGFQSAMDEAKNLQRISLEEAFANMHGYDESVPDYNEEVAMGLRYGRSCFDFTNSWDYDKLTAEEDFTGMTDAEIYKSIYEKYQHCYGEDFFSCHYIGYYLPPTDYNYYIPILNKFEKEVSNACGTDRTGNRKLRREALYGDMSSTEIRQSIIDKYDLSDGLSVRELYQMSGEMWAVGLDGGLSNTLDDLWFDPLTSTSGPDYTLREQMLDTNVTGSMFDQLDVFYRGRIFVGSPVDGNYLSALSQIQTAANRSRFLSRRSQQGLQQGI